MIEVATIKIAQRRVRKINVSDIPVAFLKPVALLCLPEKSQLIPECAAIACLEIARRVPPFRLKIRMRKKIARKFVPITWERSSIRYFLSRKKYPRERDADRSTLHAQSRLGSTERQCAPGKNLLKPSQRKSAKLPRSKLQRASENESSTQTTAC